MPPRTVGGSWSETEEGPDPAWTAQHEHDLPGRRGAPRPARAAGGDRRGARPVRRPARPGAGRGGAGGGGRGARRPPDDARRPADQRAARRRGHPGPAARRGAGRCARRCGRPVPRAPDPGGGRVPDLTRPDVAELSRLLTAGEVSAVEVTRAHLDRIAAEDAQLGAYLFVDDEAALAAATAVDEARSGG